MVFIGGARHLPRGRAPLAPRTKPWRDAKMRHDPDDAKIGATVAKSFSVRARLNPSALPITNEAKLHLGD